MGLGMKICALEALSRSSIVDNRYFFCPGGIFRFADDAEMLTKALMPIARRFLL